MGTRCDQQVTLLARQQLSESCFSLLLACQRPLEAQPGQFAMLGLPTCGDPLLRRPFSLAAISHQEGRPVVELLVKEVGRVTAALRRLPPGSPLQLLAPLGRGFDLAAVGSYPALVAGGIGLPPVLFAAQELAARGIRFDFFFGAATGSELLLLERLRQLVTGELVLSTDDGSVGEKGLVTEALTRRLGRGYSGMLACGPSPMLRALACLARARALVAELSLEEPMACGLGVCLGCVVKLASGAYVPSCQEGPVFFASELAEAW